MTRPDDVTLLVREGAVDEIRFASRPVAEPGADELLVRVEKFGFSANNVTYAVLGRSLRYFEFFPSGEEGWGRVPVWGMGRVVASRNPTVAEGTRMYGYFPLARYQTLKPAKAIPTGFEVDRGTLPSVYNQYALVGANPFHVPEQEDAMLVFRPVVLTGCLLDDYLAHHEFFGADAVLISSASAKTAFGLAFMLARRPRDERPEIVGLTSARNRAFALRLGLYDRVVLYDEVTAARPDQRIVFVDVAGDGKTLAAVHAHYRDRWAAGVLVGMSHWQDSPMANPGAAAAPPPPNTEFFFAPSWVDQRQRELGAAGFGAMLLEGWRAFMAGADERCRIARDTGTDAVAAAYQAVASGAQRADEGRVLSLWDDAFARTAGPR